MDEKDKHIAEAVLRRLCQGAQIDGIRFGPVLQILITNHTSEKELIKGQIYLNLGSSWRVFDPLPSSLPNGEEELPELPQEEQIQAICTIRERVIVGVELGKIEPHLVLTLDDGRVIFVSGKHDMYECWQMGVALSGTEEPWLVVACPGGGVAVWAPQNFIA